MRLFVVGDIHGCFDLLEHELEKVNFDKSQDLLISVGDLVDRGPDSLAALEYIKQPWFKAVMGNHEAMLYPAFAGSYWHCQNGGSWFNDFTDETSREHALEAVQPLLRLPIMLEQWNNGKRYGFVHASMDGFTKWDNAVIYAESIKPYDEHPMLWDRTQIRYATDVRYNDKFLIEDMDHVYMGHTPLREPLTAGNCTWLDTGAFATGRLTVLEIK